MQFTGQKLDSTGLYYYNARYYDPTIGRFISPDRFIQEFIYPQSLNRYTYVFNNPLKYNDPRGNIVWAIIGKAVLGAVSNVIGYVAVTHVSGQSMTMGGFLGAAASGAVTGFGFGILKPLQVADKVTMTGKAASGAIGSQAGSMVEMNLQGSGSAGDYFGGSISGALCGGATAFLDTVITNPIVDFVVGVAVDAADQAVGNTISNSGVFNALDVTGTPSGTQTIAQPTAEEIYASFASNGYQDSGLYAAAASLASQSSSGTGNSSISYDYSDEWWEYYW